MKKGQTPKELFQEYKNKANRIIDDPFIEDYHSRQWRRTKRAFERVVTLIEIYARIASFRDGHDYLKDWRL